MGKLATFNFPYTEHLRGTVFYEKRETISQKTLSNVPAYRALKLLKKIAEANDVFEFDDYLYWVQMPINDEDEQFDQVKRFKRRYGHDFKFCRYLLTVKNSIDLYISTHQ